MGLAASPAQAAVDGAAVTEVAPWASGNSPYGADWFEVTNRGTAPLSLAGWRVDDSSNALATALPLNGVGALAPGESAVFLEAADPATTVAAFRSFWNPPAGLQIGTYTGQGIGLSTGGDAVNLFDASGTPRAGVSFGVADATAPYQSFDNPAGADGAISALSTEGANGANAAGSSPFAAVGSPGLAPAGSTTPPTTTPPTTTPPAPVVSRPWPGGADLTTVDAQDFVTENLSGLTQTGTGAGAVLWAVQNNGDATRSSSTLHKLVPSGAGFVPDSTYAAQGRPLRYPDGTGNPDAEGITVGGPSLSDGLFVATERNNAVSGTSRNAVLRFDASSSASPLPATREWVLTDLPPTGANLGLETITWVPDSFLVARGLKVQSSGAAYDPAAYPDHGSGLFFVGVEATGLFYGYALNQVDGTATRITSFTSGLAGVMASEFDPATGEFWAHCDNGCLNRSTVLRLSSATGTFAPVALLERPGAMPEAANTEGFAIAPDSECTGTGDGRVKPVYWSDDSDGGGFSLRRGTLTCAALPTPVVPEFPLAALGLVVAGAAAAGSVLVRRRVG